VLRLGARTQSRSLLQRSLLRFALRVPQRPDSLATHSRVILYKTKRPLFSTASLSLSLFRGF
jgi:hypothetical protein